MIPVELVGVRVEVPANTPMVLLREQEGRHRLLPIYIGTPEASAIHFALEGIAPPRPFTHDLFLTTIDELGATLDKVVVTEMRDRTFYAELHLTIDAGDAESTKVISCRPSDAIALAVRCGASLFAGDELLDEHGQEPPEEPEEDAAEIIDEFKDFLDEVNPEDFG